MFKQTVSATHASIKKNASGWEIWQHAVTNATYLNGTPLTMYGILKDGDIITICKRSFRFNYKEKDYFDRSVDMLKKLLQYCKPFSICDYGMMCWKCDSVVNPKTVKNFGCCSVCHSKKIMEMDGRFQKIWEKFFARMDVQEIVKNNGMMKIDENFLMEKSLLSIEYNWWRIHLKNEMRHLGESINLN